MRVEVPARIDREAPPHARHRSIGVGLIGPTGQDLERLAVESARTGNREVALKAWRGTPLRRLRGGRGVLAPARCKRAWPHSSSIMNCVFP